jgi:hypothetical protein
VLYFIYLFNFFFLPINTLLRFVKRNLNLAFQRLLLLTISIIILDLAFNFFFFFFSIKHNFFFFFFSSLFKFPLPMKCITCVRTVFLTVDAGSSGPLRSTIHYRVHSNLLQMSEKRQKAHRCFYRRHSDTKVKI